LRIPQFALVAITESLVREYGHDTIDQGLHYRRIVSNFALRANLGEIERGQLLFAFEHAIHPMAKFHAQLRFLNKLGEINTKFLNNIEWVPATFDNVIVIWWDAGILGLGVLGRFGVSGECRLILSSLAAALLEIAICFWVGEHKRNADGIHHRLHVNFQTTEIAR